MPSSDIEKSPAGQLGRYNSSGQTKGAMLSSETESLPAGQLGRYSSATAAAMMTSGVGQTLQRLVSSRSHRSQVCGLRELAALALSSDTVAAQLLTPPLLAGLLVRSIVCTFSTSPV
jgi:hypothetical protein